jgi:hypothetical protein
MTMLEYYHNHAWILSWLCLNTIITMLEYYHDYAWIYHDHAWILSWLCLNTIITMLEYYHNYAWILSHLWITLITVLAWDALPTMSWITVPSHPDKDPTGISLPPVPSLWTWGHPSPPMVASVSDRDCALSTGSSHCYALWNGLTVLFPLDSSPRMLSLLALTIVSVLTLTVLAWLSC